MHEVEHPYRNGLYLHSSFGARRRSRRCSWHSRAATFVSWLVLGAIAVGAVACLLGFVVVLYGVVLIVAAVLRVALGVGAF